MTSPKQSQGQLPVQHQPQQSLSTAFEAKRQSGATSRLARKLNHSLSKVRDSSGLPEDILSPDNINVQLFEHIGFPESADALAYEQTQGLLAIATSDGRIKLVGKRGVEVTVLTSKKGDCEASTILFSFLKGRGCLLRVDGNGQVQLIDVSKCAMISSVTIPEQRVTAAAIIPRAPYVMLGCESGDCYFVEITKRRKYERDQRIMDLQNHHSGLRILPYKSK